MPATIKRINSLFRSYAEALVERDFPRAAALSLVPLPISHPTGNNILPTLADVASDLRDFFEPWAATGVAAVTHKLNDVNSHCHGFFMVDIEWQMRGSNGEIRATTHTSYGLRQEGDTLGICSVFSHDEIMQRPMQSREADVSAT